MSTAVTNNANGTNARPPSLIPGLVATTTKPQGGVPIPATRQNHFETPSYTAFSPSHTPTTTSPEDKHDKIEIEITPSPHPTSPRPLCRASLTRLPTCRRNIGTGATETPRWSRSRFAGGPAGAKTTRYRRGTTSGRSSRTRSSSISPMGSMKRPPSVSCT